MKVMILAAALAALPLFSYAQEKNDTSQRPPERDETRASARKAAETGVAEAAKLGASIEAAIQELADSAEAFVKAVSDSLSPEDSTKAEAGGKIAVAQSKLEIAGVKLETLYDRAVRLRVKAEASLDTGAREAGRRAPIAVPDSVKGRPAAEARLRLANAQMAGGDAAALLVEEKIRRAKSGQDSASSAGAVERLRAAAIEISRAKGALAKAAEEAGEIGAARPGEAGGKAAGPAKRTR